MMICPECDMGYDEDYLDNRRLHHIYHDGIVHGVRAAQRKSETVVWRQGHDRIVVVTAVSPKAERIRARKVGRVTNQDMHNDGGIYHEDEPPDDRHIHLFLYCWGNRAVGLAIFERRSSVWHYTWEEFAHHVQKPLEEHDPLWSLGLMWVHKTSRRRGLARLLFHEAVGFLGVRTDAIGLYTPLSSDGEAWARSIFREGFLIAK